MSVSVSSLVFKALSGHSTAAAINASNTDANMMPVFSVVNEPLNYLGCSLGPVNVRGPGFFDAKD